MKGLIAERKSTKRVGQVWRIYDTRYETICYRVIDLRLGREEKVGSVIHDTQDKAVKSLEHWMRYGKALVITG